MTSLFVKSEPLEPLDLPTLVRDLDDELRLGGLEGADGVSSVKAAVQVRPVNRGHLCGVLEQPAHESFLIGVHPRRDGPQSSSACLCRRERAW